MEDAGKINTYICVEHRHETVTVNLDNGVTPFMIGCRHEGCDSDARSCFYKVPQYLVPSHEWYMPDEAELKTMDPRDREHAEAGGLFLREISVEDQEAAKRAAEKARHETMSETCVAILAQVTKEREKINERPRYQQKHFLIRHRIIDLDECERDAGLVLEGLGVASSSKMMEKNGAKLFVSIDLHYRLVTCIFDNMMEGFGHHIIGLYHKENPLVEEEESGEEKTDGKETDSGQTSAD